MPKIFVLRDRLAEQQARLRANDKNGVNGGGNGGNGFPVNLASTSASSAPSASEDAAGTSQQQPLNLQSRPQYAPKIGKNDESSREFGRKLA